MAIVRITPAGESIQCKAGETAEFQFTISNSAERDLRYGAQIKSSDCDWLKVDGKLENDLMEGGDTVIKVLAEPPEDVENKSFTFQLQIYDAREPEEAVDSATVSVEVSKPVSENKKPFPWIFPVIGVAAAFVIGLSTWLLWPEEKLSSYVGSTFTDELGEKLYNKNFTVAISEIVSEEEAGYIISQDPREGTKLSDIETDKDKRKTIAFTISAVSIETPDLVGMTVEDAKATLAAANLTLGEVTVEEVSSRGLVPSPKILKQSPEASSPVLPESTVNLVVAKQMVKLADYKGQRYSVVARKLAKLGLSIKQDVQPAGLVNPGFVYAQEPGAGESVNLGSTVTLRVEKTKVAVPNTIGKRPKDAIKMLRHAGFRVVYKIKGRTSTSNAVKVRTQEPRSGDIYMGSKITITYPRKVSKPTASVYQYIPNVVLMTSPIKAQKMKK